MLLWEIRILVMLLDSLEDENCILSHFFKFSSMAFQQVLVHCCMNQSSNTYLVILLPLKKFQAAAVNGNLALVQLLVENGANLHAENEVCTLFICINYNSCVQYVKMIGTVSFLLQTDFFGVWEFHRFYTFGLFFSCSHSHIKKPKIFSKPRSRSSGLVV